MIPVVLTIFTACQVCSLYFSIAPNITSFAGLFGGLLSVLMAGLASHETYDKFSGGMEEADKG